MTPFSQKDTQSKDASSFPLAAETFSQSSNNENQQDTVSLNKLSSSVAKEYELSKQEHEHNFFPSTVHARAFPLEVSPKSALMEMTEDFSEDDETNENKFYHEEIKSSLNALESKKQAVFRLFLFFLIAIAIDVLVFILLIVLILLPSFSLKLLAPSTYSLQYSFLDLLIFVSFALPFSLLSFLLFYLNTPPLKCKSLVDFVFIPGCSFEVIINNESMPSSSRRFINRSKHFFKRKKCYSIVDFPNVNDRAQISHSHPVNPAFLEEGKGAQKSNPNEIPCSPSNSTKASSSVAGTKENIFLILTRLTVHLYLFCGFLKLLCWSWSHPPRALGDLYPLFSVSHILIMWSFGGALCLSIILKRFKFNLKVFEKGLEDHHKEMISLDLRRCDYQKYLQEKELRLMNMEYQSSLTWWQLFLVLKPYFWPTGGIDKAGRKLLLRLQTVSTWLCVIGSKIANVIAPVYLGIATNALIPGHMKDVSINLAAFCGLTLLSKVLKEVQSLLYLKVSQEAFIEIAETTYQHVHNLSISWHVKKKIGGVLRSVDRGISATNSLMQFGFLNLIPALGECASVVLVLLFHYKSTYLVALLTVSLALYYTCTVKLTIWRGKLRSASNKRDNKYHDIATDALMNFETVKYFTNEDYETHRFCKAIREFQTYGTATSAALNFLNISQQIIRQITIFVALILTGASILRNEMKVGDFVSINIYLINIFVPLSMLGTLYGSIIQSWVDIENLSQLLAEKPEIVNNETAAPLLRSSILPCGETIEFRNVGFRYMGQPQMNALSNISFTIPAGRTIAVVGETGSGKSTLGKLLSRLYEVKTGAIYINGQNIADIQLSSLRSNIGIVPQDTILFNSTLYQNILYGQLDASYEEVEKVVEAVQLKQFVSTMPEKLNTRVGERGLKLSGGEQQRVAIARCLLKNPPIVILDEATSALDSVTEAAIQKALSELRVGRTLLIIAHRLSTIKDADEILVLRKGKIIERGSHAELLKLENEYYRMWKLQEKTKISSKTDAESVDTALKS